jgi:hypothetical protein
MTVCSRAVMEKRKPSSGVARTESSVGMEISFVVSYGLRATALKNV